MLNSSVSVIICTLDRGNFLRRVMTNIASWRSAFQELIVVVGPTQDDTECILSENKHLINQIIFTDLRNVSIARNLGLRAASQEIILYLDDDVIASTEWVASHVRAHQEQGLSCGCVAGAVADKTRSDTPLQFSRGVHNRLSVSHPVLSIAAEQRYLSSSRWFSGVMGANASYKREALMKIGCFDEFFEYFLEETDVCLRLSNAGYTIHRIDVTVNHYVQPSHNRRDRRHLTCWYSLAKNTTYFALKHGEECIYSPIFLMRLAGLLMYRCLLRILRLRFTHHLPNALLLQYIREAIAGVGEGLKAGLQFHNAKSYQLAEPKKQLSGE
ncbi:MAG TPA: glycosyltransferase family 2 protein [Leptolyngbyaceae cyanobacterium M33_DOE_097]|uniref:Glycosyltransferase family 2 protein n=1 Tax=Oscillatoriales cyanobacterium SpSt-418 TaxID=2282169 RepID=A0A7C3KHJ3_9CYAN|nr:glycosyltransferase family 2 protein [Leptolyngbyaceae cyanobacterium M33_DOE_097]